MYASSARRKALQIAARRYSKTSIKTGFVRPGNVPYSSARASGRAVGIADDESTLCAPFNAGEESGEETRRWRRTLRSCRNSSGLPQANCDPAVEKAPAAMSDRGELRL
jgi:hypothetical protein